MDWSEEEELSEEEESEESEEEYAVESDNSNSAPSNTVFTIPRPASSSSSSSSVSKLVRFTLHGQQIYRARANATKFNKPANLHKSLKSVLVLYFPVLISQRCYAIVPQLLLSVVSVSCCIYRWI